MVYLFVYVMCGCLCVYVRMCACVFEVGNVVSRLLGMFS